ncbi:MAG TPA: HEAT repeat domain-containing protein, partial [Planctomycetaceae bacterium]|nr:HEAT repeat domain-containing protein [Planctomycetaceae bacterium]
MPKFLTNILILSLFFSIFADPGTTRSAFAQTDGPLSATPEEEPEESPLLTEPETPEELFKAIDLMIKLGRPKLGRKYLQQLMESKPKDDLVLELRDKYGLATFLRFANLEALQPYSRQLLDQSNLALKARAEDPAYLRSLIDDLQAGGTAQQLAMISLINLGAPSVPILLQELAVTEKGDLRDTYLLAIVQIGPGTVPVLRGGLLNPDEKIQTAAIEALGWLGNREVVPFLWYPAFGNHDLTGLKASARISLMRLLKKENLEEVSTLSQASLADELNRQVSLHLNHQYRWKTDEQGQLTFWDWDSQSNELKPKSITAQEASLIVGSHFARQLVATVPENRKAQATSIALSLATEFYRVGWDQPLATGAGTAHDEALAAGTAVVIDAIDVGLAHSNDLAALASVQILTQLASEGTVKLSEKQQSSLLAAMNAPSHRIQFAAANALLTINPDNQFSRPERVIEILAQALNDTRKFQALIIDPDIDRSRSLGNNLEARGIGFSTVRTGREGFELAASRMDVQLIAIHINSIRWPLSQTVSNLRADARTASIPMIVYGPQSQEYKLQPLIERTSRSIYVASDLDAVQKLHKIQNFRQSLGNPELTPELRQQQIGRAVSWLAAIASGKLTTNFNLAPAEQALTDTVRQP